MVRLVGADREAVVTQIATAGEQDKRPVSGCSTAAETTSGSSPVEAAVTQTPQHWTVEDRNTTWSDESGLVPKLQVVRSQSGVGRMDPQTQPALCRQSRLLEVEV